MSREDLEDKSDKSSVLSDIPSLYDDNSIEPTDLMFDDPDTSPQTPFTTQDSLFNYCRKRKRATSITSDETSSFSDNDPYVDVECLPRTSKSVIKNAPLASIELLPNEILQKIAVYLQSDTDLRSLILSSPLFPTTINNEQSETWRLRFLHQYDYPFVEGPFDFSAAYKLRKLVLQNFISVADGITRRVEIQMEVLRDILIESYNFRNAWSPRPTTSLNMLQINARETPEWLRIFLAVPFPGITDKDRYGKPHRQFESLQLVLSHLVLSPESAAVSRIPSSRQRYDLDRVYQFEKRLSALYVRVITAEDKPRSSSVLRNSMFPNLRLPKSPDTSATFALDTNSLLHIRNFWHRHLNDNDEFAGEHTYARMARFLASMKTPKVPKPWHTALDASFTIPTTWYGHYSCLHPWPKTEKVLQERQTSAEDWESVDPMVLEFVTSTDYADGFWPQALSNIPAFRETVPDPASYAYPLHNSSSDTWRRTSGSPYDQNAHLYPRSGDPPVYIRGIATFMRPAENTNEENTTPSSSSSITDTNAAINRQRDEYLKHHPFNSLRLRGVIHDIPADATVDDATKADEVAIPGWKRVVMVLYKPNISYLVTVLEHAAEEYGGSFGTQVTNALNTASVWLHNSTNAGANGNDSHTSAAPGASGNASNAPATQSATDVSAVPPPTAQSGTTNPQPQQYPIDPAVLEAHLHNRLHDLLTTSSALPTSYTVPNIHRLEDTFSPPHYLSWDGDDGTGSIDIAYAYEGAIIPGGQIMLGRWWRCHGGADAGLGVGMEVDVHGRGVGDDSDEGDDDDDDGDDDDDDGDDDDDDGDYEEIGSDVDVDIQMAGGAAMNENANANDSDSGMSTDDDQNGSGNGSNGGNVSGGAAARQEAARHATSTSTSNSTSNSNTRTRTRTRTRTSRDLERGPFIFWS